MAKKIDLVIKSTLDKAGFDAASKSVKTLEAEVSAGASNFDKFGNVSQAVSSAISGDIKGVTNNVFNLTKSLKNVGGALGGLAAAAGPVALVATVAVGAYNAIKALGENIKKAREEAEKARIERQAAALRDLKTIYGELTAQVERYAKIQAVAADNAIRMQNAANGLQQSQLSARMNEELKNAPAEKHDEIRQRYSRYAQDVKDAQELKNIELEMAKNEAEIAKQEKLASEAVKFYNSQLDAKNRLISDTAKRIAGAEDFKGTSDEAMAKAAEDSAVRQAVEAEKQARAAMESAQAELMKLKAAQDVAKVRAAEVKQNSANARAAREIEDRAKLEAEHQKALDEALEKKAQLAEKVAEAEKALVRAQEQERNQARTKELQEQLDLMQQQVAAAKQLLGVANQGGNRGRVRNLEEADKAAKKAAREEERQRKRDDARLKAIENRTLGGKFARDVNGNLYLRGLNGEDITGRLRGKDAEFVRRMNELNAAEQAAAMAQANANAVKRQIEEAQNAGRQNPAQAAQEAVDAAKKEAEAAQEAIDKIENKFAADLTSLSEAFASYQSGLEAVVREVNAPAAAAVETLNSNFADLKVALRTLLTAQ